MGGFDSEDQPLADAEDSWMDVIACAAAEDDVETLQDMMFRHGPGNVDARVSLIGSALHVASSSGSVHASALLLDNKADINLLEGADGFTPLHYAAGEGHEAVVALLLERGANTGATDAHGNTPSEWAATVSIRRMITEGSHRQENDFAASRTGGGSGGGGSEEKRGGSVEREARRSGALRRLSQRLVEIGEAEEGLVFDLQRLAEAMQNLGDDREVGLDDKGIQLAAEVMSHSIALSEVHVMLRSQILSCDGCAASVAGVFEDPNTSAQLAEWHSRYEAVSSRLLLVLHSLAGGLVVGDRAVGEIGGEEIDSRVAAVVPEVLDLLRLPTQRLMKYQSFLDDMLKDAKLLDDQGLVWSLQSSLEAVKGAVGTVNERKRNWERRERVSLVADRLFDVPTGLDIKRRDREFVFDQDNFLQRERPGYRKLVLFTDAVLVCEQVPCGSGSVNFIEAALSPSPSRSSATLSWGGRRGCTPKKDLRFKDLISLHRLELSDCPYVLEPSASSMSLDASAVSNRERSFSFELKGRVFHGTKEAVETWVDAIRETVLQLVKKRNDPRSSYHVPPDAVDYGLAPGERSVSAKDEDDCVILYSF